MRVLCHLFFTCTISRTKPQRAQEVRVAVEGLVARLRFHSTCIRWHDAVHLKYIVWWAHYVGLWWYYLTGPSYLVVRR